MIRYSIRVSILAVAALIFSVLPFTGCRSVANKASSPEAVSMVNAASEARDYERIQFLADSLGTAGKLSKGESYYWQGYANYHLGHNELAEYYWEEAIRVTEPSTDPNDLVYYAKSGNRLGSLLCRLGEYASALHQTLPVINRLEKMQCDTTSDYTNLLIFAGCSKTFFNKEDPTATDMLERAYQMHINNIQQKASKTSYRDAIAGIINTAYIWIYVEGYEKGLFWTERLGDLVKEYTDLYGEDRGYSEKQWARYKIFQAISLEGLGRHEEAERSYDEYRQTEFSQTMEGLTNASDYLTVAQRWEEAVTSYRTIMDYLQSELNIYSLDNIHRYLLKKYRAYQMLGQQDSINHTARQICDVLDSAIVNNRQLDASELHSIHVRDMEIVEAEARSARQRGVYTTILVLVLIIAFTIYIIFRQLPVQISDFPVDLLDKRSSHFDDDHLFPDHLFIQDIQICFIHCPVFQQTVPFLQKILIAVHRQKISGRNLRNFLVHDLSSFPRHFIEEIQIVGRKDDHIQKADKVACLLYRIPVDQQCLSLGMNDSTKFLSVTFIREYASDFSKRHIFPDQLLFIQDPV